MTDLKDEDIEISEMWGAGTNQGDWVQLQYFTVNLKKTFSTQKEAKQLKKQILENQDKAEKWDEYLKLSREKGTILENKLEQENKQLKEQEWQHQQVLAREMSMVESLVKDRDKYKEIVQKVTEWIEKLGYDADPSIGTIKQDLKEILATGDKDE